MESETLSLYFSFCYVKICWSMLHFGSFAHAWFYNMKHWLFRKSGSLSYADIPNMDIFHYIITKYPIHYITDLVRRNIPEISIEKLSALPSWIQVSQNSEFHWKVEILSLGTDTVSCFLWRDRFPLFISTKYAGYPSLNNHNHLYLKVIFLE